MILLVLLPILILGFGLLSTGLVSVDLIPFLVTTNLVGHKGVNIPNEDRGSGATIPTGNCYAALLPGGTPSIVMGTHLPGSSAFSTARIIPWLSIPPIFFGSRLTRKRAVTPFSSSGL